MNLLVWIERSLVTDKSMKILLIVLVAAAVAMADEASLQKVLVEGNNQFTSKFFSEVVKEKPSQSVVLSAVSVLPPLAQLALASAGDSHDELLSAIGLNDDNTTKEVISMVNNRLRSVKGITLKMANRVYIPTGRQLNQDFAKLSRDVFQSEVKNVDFTKNVETAQEVNSWVEDQTNHRIKDLVDPSSLDANTRALLVNALYFKGSWNRKFEPKLTLERDFHVDKETTVKVPTMYQKGSFKYGDSKELNAKLLEMSYEGNEASFLVVLPNEVDGLAALEEKLRDPSALPKAVESMFTTTVEVYLPKFKIETTTNLMSILQKIGVQKLFTAGQARLDHLLQGSSDLYVSNAIQKAFIEVNEEGAEAAAANDSFLERQAGKQVMEQFCQYGNVIGIEQAETAFGVSFTTAVHYQPPIPRFRADHPFVFVLKTQDTTLFNGAYHSE